MSNTGGAMNRTFRALLLALFLTAIGLGIFFHKLTNLDVPLSPNQAYRSWYVEAKLSVNSDKSVFPNETNNETQSTNIQLYLPQESQRYKIVDEDFTDGRFQRQVRVQNSVNRVAVFTRDDNANNKFIFYRAIIRRQEAVSPGTEKVPISGRRLVDQELVKFGENTARVEDNLKENPPTEEVNALLNEAKKQSSDNLVLTSKIYQIALRTDDIRVDAIRRNLRNQKSTPELAAFLLKSANVPARVGNGILLRSKEVYSTDFIQWLEIQDGNRWLAFDPIDSSFKQQDRYLTWWYGSDRVLQAKGPSNIALEVVVQPNTDKGLTNTIRKGEKASSTLLDYSLFNLPLANQRVFQVLVLVPIGALVISILHQMIGLKTFGTFTPILIALSFRQTGLIIGIPLFILVVIIGLLIRAYLNKLQLLIVPRLAAILTATVLIMAFLAIIMEHFNINLGLSISLFPIVILAMTIERAAVTWEEEGATETIIAGLGSLLAATIGYFCIINDYVQHLAFAFPELLLLVLALNILVGRYNGYKLIEYFRFRSLQRQLKQTEG